MIKIFGILIIFALGVAVGVDYQGGDFFQEISSKLEQYQRPTKNISQISKISKTADRKIDICFTPPSGCTKLIVQEINKAKNSIYVQAYGLSDPMISQALIDAKLRGVKVKILADRSNLSQKFSRISQLKQAKINIGIDKVPGIAHNKVMIIDKRKVITGSFNFTQSADKRNAENVLIIEDEEVAESYYQNWLSRKAQNQK